MIPSDSNKAVQDFVYNLQIGKLKALILRISFFFAVAGIAALYLIIQFRGFDSEPAMDQAQVGRQIASGSGFSTLYIRPLAIWQILDKKGALPAGNFPDTYNAPLNPALNAVLLRPFKQWWPMEPTDYIYIGDRIIASGGVALLFASCFVFFFLIRALFDRKIAWMAIGLTFLTDLLWRFSVSGLPQMLLFFFFSLALLLLYAAISAHKKEKLGLAFLSLSGTAVMLGLMALTQPLSAWLFLGFLPFVAFVFKPRFVSTLLVFFIFVLIVSPWIFYNYQVSGNPLGLSFYSAFDRLTGPDSSLMHFIQPDMSTVGGLKSKLRDGVLAQFQNIFSFFGYNLAAIAFFFSLLHIFRRSETKIFRWALLAMWLPSIFGMAVFQPKSDVSINQLHILFLPLFAAYGIAFLLVLWNRMDVRFQPARFAFLVMIFFVSSLPLVLNLAFPPAKRINWPPYIPPLINAVSSWMKPNELLCSDMPWATAWYGDRISLLLPNSVKQFLLMYDYKYLGGPINGLFLTPITGDRPFLSEISKGDLSEWAPIITRKANLSNFPLQHYITLPIHEQCVFYSNRPRWLPEQESQP